MRSKLTAIRRVFSFGMLATNFARRPRSVRQFYSKEELCAEMGAAYLCAEAGISTAVIDNQAAYVAGWLKKLRDDRKLLIHAAAEAQHAADYILNIGAL